MSFERRDFIKGVAATDLLTLGSGIAGPLIKIADATSSKEMDFGKCESVKVTCISETAWFDPARRLKDIQTRRSPQKGCCSCGLKRNERPRDSPALWLIQDVFSGTRKMKG